MEQVGVYEAKTQLPRLLERVNRGETIVITKHGRPVAQLVPVKATRSVEEIIASIRNRRASLPKGDLRMKDLIEEGRRH